MHDVTSSRETADKSQDEIIIPYIFFFYAGIVLFTCSCNLGQFSKTANIVGERVGHFLTASGLCN